ncbi:MAG: phenylalanine--tRNA ligase subunit alpha [Ignavibacteriae bacterium]|nr:phenylalanine--tRNA ligase subunit alpha [Ignavibacteriota bacterium]
MLEKIAHIKQEFSSDLAQANDAQALENLRIKYLARKGSIAALFYELKSVSPEEKPALGKALNELRTFAQSAYDDAKLKLEQSSDSTELPFDVTLPGRPVSVGTKHPITQTIEEIVRIFKGMGFTVATGPEVETDYYNFGALNFPPDHPARDMQDTFFIAKDILLRTHTSPVQIRYMEQHKPPVRVVIPGRVYRNEAVSARSHVLFHQVEGLYVDEGVTMGDLKGTLVAFVKQFYGSSVKYKFRPTFFPFTEPSADMYISCFICNGKGCSMCKYAGWLEILGSGMVHPHLYENVGYDTEKYTGFAFGMGVERIAILRHGIDDIRLFTENDLRFLKQF